MNDADDRREILFRRVQAAYEAGAPALTVLRARQYLRNCPWEPFLDGLVWLHLGEILGELGRYAEARDALFEALRLFSDERKRFPLCELGHLSGRQGDFAEAANWFRKAIEAHPSHASGSIYLGSVLALQGDLAGAEGVYEAAIATCYEGCLEELFLNLGLVLRAQERFSEAAECFREAIRRAPGYREARQALRDVERCLRMLNRRR